MSELPSVRLAYNPGPVNAYKALDPVRPSVRLAYHPEGDRTLSDMGKETGPTVRLVAPNITSDLQGVVTLLKENAPTVRLAWPSGGNGGPTQREDMMAEKFVEQSKPALLVSYVYLAPFLKNRHRYAYRDWVLDSGAFSAHNSGTEIKLQDYINCCKELKATDPTMTEVFALDVIGDWRASLKNCEEMWRQGVEAIPCYHVGEPEAELKAMAKDYPKIALGGCVGFKQKLKFAEQAFARVWPKAIHGFGFGSEKDIMALPWHSVDATNWEIGPCKFGRWNAFGQMSVRGSKQNLRAEVEWYLDLERRARQKWAGAMKQLAVVGPIVRLACQLASDEQIRRSGLTAASRQPTADN
jgi:hypothetical protein